MIKLQHFFTIAQLAVFIAFSSHVRASEVLFSNDLNSGHVSKALTVVEITGTLRGSGILILLNDRPAVLTNSHNIQGRKEATVRLPERVNGFYEFSKNYSYNYYVISMDVKARVVHDYPLEDFAILELPNSFSKIEEKILYTYAAKNGQICLDKSICKRGWNPGKDRSTLIDYVSAVLDGKNQSQELVAPILPVLVEDKYISGEKDKILSIPVYTRPGVSGGAFYFNGLLEGLVTKVSLGGEPRTLAIQLKSIADTLLKNKPLRSYWEKGKLVIEEGNEKIVVASDDNGGAETGNGGAETGNGGAETGNGGAETGNGGAETGNGGAETGNGGAETGNGGAETGNGGAETGNGGITNNRYWNLEVFDIWGEYTISSWNPFYNRPHIFRINGTRVAFLESKKKYQTPQIGLYRYNKRKKIKQSAHSHTQENLDLLEAKRLEQDYNMTRMKLYEYKKESKTYKLKRSFFSSLLQTGTQFLLPERNGKWQKPLGLREYPNSIFAFEPGKLNQDGYFESLFFAARKSENILDVLLTGEFPLLGKRAIGGTNHVLAHRDLQTIELTLTHSNETKKVVLYRKKNPSIGTISFADKENKIKAVYLYDSEDLIHLGRIYIQTSNMLLEFWNCDNQNSGCIE